LSKNNQDQIDKEILIEPVRNEDLHLLKKYIEINPLENLEEI